MKKIVIIFIFLFAFSARSGIRVVGNPSGFIENQIVFSWGQLAKSFESCLTRHCTANTTESNFLIALLPSLQKQLIKIEFRSESEWPDFKGNLSTTHHHGPQTLISFNVDKLYRLYSDPIQFSFLSSIEILLTALGSEFSGVTEDGLKKLARLIYDISFQSEVNTDLASFGLPSLYLKITGPNSSKLLVNDESGLKDITLLLDKKLICPDAQLGEISNLKWVTVSGYDPAKNLLGLDSLIELNCSKFGYLANVFVEIPVKDDLNLGHLFEIDSIRLSVRNLRKN